MQIRLFLEIHVCNLSTPQEDPEKGPTHERLLLCHLDGCRNQSCKQFPGFWGSLYVRICEPGFLSTLEKQWKDFFFNCCSSLVFLVLGSWLQKILSIMAGKAYKLLSWWSEAEKKDGVRSRYYLSSSLSRDLLVNPSRFYLLGVHHLLKGHHC